MVLCTLNNTQPISAEAPVTPGKRKAESKKDTPPAKKAKSEGEGKDKCTGPINQISVFNYDDHKGLNTDV